MRILIYGINYKPEIVGIGKYTGEMAEWLSNIGHDIRVITAPKYYPEWQTNKNKYYSEKINRIKIYRSPLFVPRNPSGIKRIVHLLSFSILSIPYLIKNISFDPDLIIVISPSFLSAPIGIIYSLILGKNTKSWIHIQDLEIDLAFKLGLIKNNFIKKLALIFEKKVLNNFDYISTISKSMKDSILSKGIKKNEIFYLPNWIDTKTKKAKKNNYYKTKYKISDKEVVVLYSGSLNNKQDLNLITKCIEITEKREDIIWFFATEGNSKKQLENFSIKKKNVYILPLQKENMITEWLSFADIHIIPQKKNTDKYLLPSKVLGILNSGKPFIATASSNSELGEITKKTGIRVNPGDYIKFANSIIKLSNNKDLRKRMGEKGKEFVKINFDKNQILSNFNYLLHKKLIIK